MFIHQTVSFKMKNGGEITLLSYSPSLLCYHYIHKGLKLAQDAALHANYAQHCFQWFWKVLRPFDIDKWTDDSSLLFISPSLFSSALCQLTVFYLNK